MKQAPLFFLILVASVYSQAQTLIGVAKSQNGEIVYLEKHEIERDQEGLNKHIRVEYSKPDGSLFATMTSDFSRSKIIPETVFEDKRFASKIIARMIGSSLEFEEFRNQKSVSKNLVPIHGSMVLGQGFDNFIKINFARLNSESVQFKFGVLGKKDFYSFTGYKKSVSSAGDIEFGIRASNWVLRLFADELKITYELKSMKLKSFSGRSNILDDSGQAQNVNITYQWQESQ